MRIWIINHYATTPNTVGITRHYNLARELIRRGHEVLIIAANYNHFSHSYTAMNIPRGAIDHTHDVPFIWIPTPAYTGNSISRLWNMLVFSWRLIWNQCLAKMQVPDIIIGSSPHLFAAFSAKRLATTLKATFIFEVRDLWPQTLIDTGKFSDKHILIHVMKWIEKYLYKKAERIISLLPGANSYLINAGVQEQNILWLPNAVDTTSVPVNSCKSNADKFTVMYAGSHGYANDLITVVKAAHILQQRGLSNKIRICLIGEGPEKNNLIELATANNLSLIEFMNPVPKHDIYSVMTQADAFVMLLKNLPVFQFGISPNKLFDYMVMGKPVIFAVNTPYNPIDEANAGLSISPSNPEALADAIYKLSLYSQQDLMMMGQRGQAFVEKHHNIAYLATLLENLLQEVTPATQV